MSAEHSDPQCPDPPHPHSSEPSSPGRSVPSRRPSRQDRLQLLRRLTLRDRQLLGWLAEHYLLSTDQIAQALFPSRRAALLRLAALHSIGAVTRFVDVTTGTSQYLYALGPLGAVVHPTAYTDPDRPSTRPPRSSIERTERIVGSHKLRHLLGVNQFFVDLHAYTRPDPNAQLARWWSEQHATAAFAAADIRPDAHGVWTAAGRTVGFFLEHDNNTENLGRVLRKLRAYERLAEFGPRYPVLLRVRSRRREANLLRALAGVPTAMPVATGVHDEHPAGPAWTLTTDPGLRRWLHELPSDHGPDNPATNPHRFTHPDTSD
ncbi:replication-relaxation family protein [Micromonospora peucetia]|uniref:replication-relaxation family protein n=1 Tax=Micromonospora peucetia TaxID=47871 RepID=UPI00225ABBEB|nr:replication-relaxation family protein [Micromonospora peucetia]MCX4387317.1 replication-relaxation family protein [Micromonospora peucetia]